MEDPDEVMVQLESDGVDLIKLSIGTGCDRDEHYYDYIPQDGDWGRLGTLIGKNSRLKELTFSFGCPDEYDPDEFTKEDCVNFLSGVACNKSIQKLTLWDSDLVGRDIFSILVPFFKKNSNFERLVIDGCVLSCDELRSLEMVLREFDSLREFEIGNWDDGASRELIQSLAGHSMLTKLTLRSSRFGRDGCAGLADLLRNRTSSLTELDLGDAELNNEKAAILATGLAEMSSMKKLDLSINEAISARGWEAIFAALQSSRCSLNMLSLRCNRIADTAVLTRALAHHTHLKTLNLNWNHNISVASWRVFFEYLRDDNCMLDELNLCYVGCNDEVMSSLTNALTNNHSLKSLDLRTNRGITNIGWQDLSAGLRNPHSVLEKLDLSSNYINDDSLISLATSLADNTSLKELITCYPRPVTSHTWAAFSNVLCNASSILATYGSNHTLQVLCEDGNQELALPEDIRSLLQLNRENSSTQAARIKIIETHFQKGFNTQPFVGMNTNVLPHAISWMCRGDRSDGVNVRFYEFLKGMPTVLEIHDNNKMGMREN